MGMVVKNNMSAVRTLSILNQNSTALQKSLSKVASGMKINSAQDDAAGYAISERMRVRIRSLDQANQNSQNDSSLMKVAEGAVSNTIEILKALKEKAINAANDSNTDEDRHQIDDNALVQFNGKYLVDGSKNSVVSATKTILLNQSLSTATSADSALTTLRNRAGDSLEIISSDYYQVSWVNNGRMYFTTGAIRTDTAITLSSLVGFALVNGSAIASVTVGTSKTPLGINKFRDDVYTPDRTEGVAIIATSSGVSNQISGFTISILDSQGKEGSQRGSRPVQTVSTRRKQDRRRSSQQGFELPRRFGSKRRD